MRDRAVRFSLIVAVIAMLVSILAAVVSVPAQAAPAQAATASIGGTIVVPAGVDAGLVAVWAVQDNAYEPEASTTLNPDGSYELSGLLPGGYRLFFTGRSGAIEQRYHGTSEQPAGELLSVTDGQQLTGINATLVKGGTISGTLTAGAGVSLTATKVYDDGVPGAWPVAADGSYKIVGLSAGSHKLWFSGDGHAMAKYYDNARTPETATSIVIAEGQDVTGIDSVLEKGASISGTVTAPPGVTLSDTRVDAVINGERGWTGYTTVAADGSYHIIGLAPGDYIVDFNASGALQQWYSSAASWRTATVISVAAGQDVTGIDAALVKAASISGTVIVPPGVDADKVRISVYAAGDPSAAITWTHIEADGSYTLGYLPAGSYAVAFATVPSTEYQGQDSGALVQWYSNADSVDDATAIVLGTGEELTGVNATLVKGASISGSVKIPDPMREYHTTVSLYASDTPGVALESTVIDHQDPRYVFKGLREGSYVVGFSTRANDAQSQWWENAATFESASVITVTRGQEVAGINAVLLRTVSGGAPAPYATPVKVTPAETVAEIDPGLAPAAAPVQASPPRQNDLNAAGPDVTAAVAGDGEPIGVAAPNGGGSTGLNAPDSGALLGSHPDAATGKSESHYLAAGWLALGPILIAAYVFSRRRLRFAREASCTGAPVEEEPVAE